METHIVTNSGFHKKLGTASVFFFVLFLAIISYSYIFFQDAVNSTSNITIQSSTEASHSDMAIIVASALSKDIYSIISDYKKTNTDYLNDITSDSRFINFDVLVRGTLSGTSIAKLKIYADDGTTIYSTQQDDIGRNEEEQEYVIHALRGRASSEFEKRSLFEGITGDIANATIVSSYHPFADSTGSVIGVVEIYSDRTTEFNKSQFLARSQKGVYLIIIAAMLSVWTAYTITILSRYKN